MFNRSSTRIICRNLASDIKNKYGAVLIDSKERIYAHPDYASGLQDHRAFQVQTAYDVIQRSTKQYADRALFSYRYASGQPFQSYTYNEVNKLIHDIGSGIVHLGLEKSNRSFMGIYASANIHYALFLYASWPFSFVPVGIYDSLGIDAVRYIVKHAELKIIFADSLRRVENLIDHRDKESKLETIISLIEPSSKLIEKARNAGIRLVTYEDLLRMGKTNPTEPKPPTPDDTAVIMYTSGSTGNPKGCIITHDNLICSAIGVTLAIDLLSLSKLEIPRVLNFMPLAHMFGCGTSLIFVFLGGEVGFWQGTPEKVIEDFRDFKPNILAMVPRLLNKMHDRIMSQAEKKGFIAQKLMETAIRAKSVRIDRGDFSQNTIWDKIVFNKIRQSFGGQVKRVISSSASLSPDVAKLSRAVFSCFFIEGYGQTECITGAWQTVNDHRLGETGVPTPVNHIKLVDVPEMNYFARDNVGEVCIRSHAVFKGYLHDEEKTRETISKDGWLYTGDIGRWTDHNTLKIIDRKKNIYKLSHGEYIAPEKIENIYSRSRFVQQIYVHGDSMQNVLVAIVVLENDVVKDWMIKNEIKSESMNDPINRKKLWEAVFTDITTIGKQHGLMSYEQIKNMTIIDEPLTVENGLLTPTFKARRHLVAKKYNQIFEDMYKALKN